MRIAKVIPENSYSQTSLGTQGQSSDATSALTMVEELKSHDAELSRASVVKIV